MYAYDELATGVVVILGILAAFTLIVNAWKSWNEVKKPSLDLHRTVHEHSTKLSDNDDRLTYLEEANRLQLDMMLTLSSHLIDGDGVDKLRDIRDRIQKFLINNGVDR